MLHVLASASFPMLFPPVEVNGKLLIDGGVRDASPLKYPIDAGYKDVTVMSCWDIHRMPKLENRNFSAIEIGARSLSIIEHELLRRDVNSCQSASRRAKLGHSKKHAVDLTLVCPRIDLGESFVFSPSNINRSYKIGYVVGSNVFVNKKVKRSKCVSITSE